MFDYDQNLSIKFKCSEVPNVYYHDKLLLQITNHLLINHMERNGIFLSHGIKVYNSAAISQSLII